MGRYTLRTYNGPPGTATFNDTWEEVMPEDKINHPAHYTQGIECIDYIESQHLGYHAGNAIKYITRYRYKNGVEDLRKAQWYIERLIRIVEFAGVDAKDDAGWDMDCSLPVEEYDVHEYEQQHREELVREVGEAMKDEAKRCGCVPDWLFGPDWSK
jgi:hypothetical protein